MKRWSYYSFLIVVLIRGSILHAQSLSGVFLTGNGEGLVAGNIHLTPDGDRVIFQSTLFQQLATGTGLDLVWESPERIISFDLGAGTAGSWELAEFLGPMPSTSPVTPGGDPIDPGFPVPVFSEGVRFSGSFARPDGIEDLFLANPGSVQLQIHGTVTMGNLVLEDPHFAAVLVPIPEPSSGVLCGAGAAMLQLWRRRRR